MLRGVLSIIQVESLIKLINKIVIVYIDLIFTSCLKEEDMKSSFCQFFLICSCIFYEKYKIRKK